MPNMVAISDASGGIGARVTRRLAERGVAMRLVVEDRSDAPQFEGTHVVEASYRDGSAMRQALGGADTMLFVPAHESADRADVQSGVVDAAVRAGVQRVVYLSFVSAAPDAVFTFARDHWHTEEHLRETGLPLTVLRGSVYMNYLFMIVGDDDVIRAPAGNGRFAPVDRHDMADVTVAALLDSSHDGRTYDVTGPELLTMSDLAAALSAAAGRTITFENETLQEAYTSRGRFGAPRWELDGWVTSLAGVAAGELDVLSDTVERLASRPPLTFEEFLAANPPD